MLLYAIRVRVTFNLMNFHDDLYIIRANMPTELDEVGDILQLKAAAAESEIVAITACRVPASWQYPDTADRYCP